MRKIALMALAGVATVASAGVNLNLNQAVQTVTLPNAGFTTVTYSGTVDVLAGWDATSALSWNASLDGVSNFKAVTFDAAFVAYLSGANAGIDYTGDLFSLDIQSTDPVGLYDQNAGSPTGTSQLIVSAVNTRNQREFSDNEYYAVNVVPEPASLIALGVGAAALLRRRNRR